MRGCGAEELAAHVDLVDPSVGEMLVHGGFDADSVVGEGDGVDVEVEGDGGSPADRDTALISGSGCRRQDAGSPSFRDI